MLDSTKMSQLFIIPEILWNQACKRRDSLYLPSMLTFQYPTKT